MTLAQVEERLTALEHVIERLTTLEKAVERLQMRVNGESKPESSLSQEQSERAEEDLIPGTEYDLVVTVPPKESILFRARIVSIEPGPPGLPLSKEEWASLGLEDGDE